MGLLTRLKQFVTSSDDDQVKPSCPGCGRPVGEPGAVCADCRGNQRRKPGG